MPNTKRTLFPGQIELIELNLNQIQALSSPATNDVYWSFSFTDPMSAREVSLEIGKASSTTGYHIEKLLSVGLLTKAGTRKRRSRIEQLYVQTADKIRTHLNGKDKTYFDAAAKGFSAIARSLGKERESAYQAMFIDPAWGESMLFRTVKVYLKPEDVLTANQLIEQLHSLVRTQSISPQEALEHGDAKRVHVFSYLTPTKSESRRQLKKSQKK